MLVMKFVNMIEDFGKNRNNMSDIEKDQFQQDFNELYKQINMDEISNQGLQLELMLAQQEINERLNQELMFFREQEMLRLEREEIERQQNLKEQELEKDEKEHSVLDDVPGLIGFMSKAMKR